MATTQHIGTRQGIDQSHDSEHLNDNIEALRQILSSQQHRDIDYEEAQEISASLVEFYQVLAEEAHDESTE
jgi:hypothetical protein